jgi:hypothetical protein
LGYLLPTLDWEEHYDDFVETRYQGIDVSQHIMAHLQMYLQPVVARTMVPWHSLKKQPNPRLKQYL